MSYITINFNDLHLWTNDWSSNNNKICFTAQQLPNLFHKGIQKSNREKKNKNLSFIRQHVDRNRKFKCNLIAITEN